MIRVIQWSADVEFDGKEACEEAYLAYASGTPMSIEGRMCRLVSFTAPPMFGEGPIRAQALAEEVGA